MRRLKKELLGRRGVPRHQRPYHDPFSSSTGRYLDLNDGWDRQRNNIIRINRRKIVKIVFIVVMAVILIAIILIVIIIITMTTTAIKIIMMI